MKNNYNLITFHLLKERAWSHGITDLNIRNKFKYGRNKVIFKEYSMGKCSMAITIFPQYNLKLYISDTQQLEISL